LKAHTLIHNARIYTQANDIVVDSMAIHKNRIVAVGRNLCHDSDFKSFSKIDFKGRTIVPGFVDAHTHFYHFALSFQKVSLYDCKSLDACLKEIEKHRRTLAGGDWVLGEGFSFEGTQRATAPDRYLLDKVTAGYPAFIFSKDQHTAWVNSRALEFAGIDKRTKDPVGGVIDHLYDGTTSGLLRESAAFEMFGKIPPSSRQQVNKGYQLALKKAYEKGVTGVHSFDRAGEAFEYFSEKASEDKLGLRINYYFPVDRLELLQKNRIEYGMGNEFLRVAGVKLFADGALGSQSAYCFNKYIGSKANYGIETMSVAEITKAVQKATRLGLPIAVHAIGDRAVSNVLDAIGKVLASGAGVRHRIEHLQLIRRKDITRLKRLGVVASMQPTHCPSDIPLIRKYWGSRAKNAFIFRTLLDRNIPVAFGSDLPIEPLDPIDGIHAAVRRAKPQSRNILNSQERISTQEAIFGFAAGPAYAAGQEHCRGFLLDGYPADFVVLSDDICCVPPTRIGDVRVLATVLDGEVKFCNS